MTDYRIVAGGGVFAETRDLDGTVDEGWPDGMKVDAADHVRRTDSGGVHAFDHDGTLLGVVLTLQETANFCSGGDGLQALFLCAGTPLFSIRLRQVGHPLFDRR